MPISKKLGFRYVEDIYVSVYIYSRIYVNLAQT